MGKDTVTIFKANNGSAIEMIDNSVKSLTLARTLLETKQELLPNDHSELLRLLVGDNKVLTFAKVMVKKRWHEQLVSITLGVNITLDEIIANLKDDITVNHGELPREKVYKIIDSPNGSHTNVGQILSNGWAVSISTFLNLGLGMGRNRKLSHFYVRIQGLNSPQQDDQYGWRFYTHDDSSIQIKYELGPKSHYSASITWGKPESEQNQTLDELSKQIIVAKHVEKMNRIIELLETLLTPEQIKELAELGDKAAIEIIARGVR